jgi:glucosamine--fructose-6-phosphate aminotransferase (isomerizing)
MTPENSIIEFFKILKGRSSIVVIFEEIEGIFAGRSGSPIIIGRGKNETYISSDIQAFLSETNIVNYFDDDEFCHIKNFNKIDFFSLKNGKKINKKNITVNYNLKSIDKKDFEHFMLKEIFEQKDTLKTVLNQNFSTFEKAISLMKKSNGLYIIGCGTAHKTALISEYFFAKISNKKVNICNASEMLYFKNFINKKSTIITISQSGETADVLEIAELAKKIKHL